MTTKAQQRRRNHEKRMKFEQELKRSNKEELEKERIKREKHSDRVNGR